MLADGAMQTIWRRILLTRGLRGFADGLVSVLLAGYLSRLGLGPAAVGAIVTGTLLGSAALTIVVGLAGHRLEPRHVLLGASILMLGTGLGFAGLTAFWPLLLVAVLGTLNPSAGDVSIFLPVEQAVLAETVRPSDRTTIFAGYNVSGTLAGALGALVSGAPAVIAERRGIDVVVAERWGFLLYAGVAVVLANVYRRLPPSTKRLAPGGTPPLARSRHIVLELSALFTLDSLGGGFVVQSLLVLWLYRRFALPVEVAGTIFFERVPRAGRDRAERTPRGHVPPAASPALADGRARPPGLRHGGGPARRTRRSGECDERPTKPGRGDSTAPDRHDARPVGVRVAPRLRRRPEARLRPPAARPLPQRAAALGGMSGRSR